MCFGDPPSAAFRSCGGIEVKMDSKVEIEMNTSSIEFLFNFLFGGIAVEGPDVGNGKQVEVLEFKPPTAMLGLFRLHSAPRT